MYITVVVTTAILGAGQEPWLPCQRDYEPHSGVNNYVSSEHIL
jgi:hypothetical protein